MQVTALPQLRKGSVDPIPRHLSNGIRAPSDLFRHHPPRMTSNLETGGAETREVPSKTALNHRIPYKSGPARGQAVVNSVGAAVTDSGAIQRGIWSIPAKYSARSTVGWSERETWTRLHSETASGDRINARWISMTPVALPIVSDAAARTIH